MSRKARRGAHLQVEMIAQQRACVNRESHCKYVFYACKRTGADGEKFDANFEVERFRIV
jgi:hypothetical protein